MLKNETDKTALKSSIICFIITVALGSLLHFTYDWSGENSIVGLFSAVNESTWEHIKLLYIPFLLCTIVENIVFGRYYRNFFFSRLVGVLAGMFFIVSAFYTYTGIIGRNFNFIDISLFVIGALIAYGVSLLMLLYHDKKKCDGILECFSIFALAIICALFFIFTYYPPDLAIFQKPSNSK